MAIQAATGLLLSQGFKMPKYVVNPFTGLLQIVPSTGAISEEQSDDPVFVPQKELSAQWIVRSHLKNPIPTIHITKIGEKELPEAIVVTPKWSYLPNDPTCLKIIFDRTPCSGFVTLHKN